MSRSTNGKFIAGTVLAALGMLISATVQANVENFNGLAAGTVVAGLMPDGGTAPGTVFPNMTLSVVNNGGGPSSLIVFDSAGPTGGDVDLGTPNEDFGGPGIGVGGRAGQPGQNDRALGKLLVIAEDITDALPADGIVDDPDDEAGGGVITFDFDFPVIVHRVVLVDIDVEAVHFSLENGGSLIGTAMSNDKGDNSLQTLDLSGFGALTRLRLDFSGSGAIGELEYFQAPVPVESTTWGRIKSDR